MDEDEYINKLNSIEIKLKELEEQKCKINNKIKILTAEKEDLQNQHNLTKIRRKKNDTDTWLGDKFEWSQQLQKLLKEKFKYENFRSKQLAAINATIAKQDVLLVMATGGGKSLVYQLPALIGSGITLVVSPLISLIDDQLRALGKLDIEAATLNSSSSKQDKNRIHDAMVNRSSTIKLLYVTPEWVVNSKVFMNNLQKCYSKGYLKRIVIDEVHCCTTWGHDFRPEYQQLGLFKTMFKGVPIVGLTATATVHTLIDIQKTLNLSDALIIMAPFNRPNLYYQVVNKPSDKSESLDYIEKLLKGKFKDKSGIIYTSTVKECEDLADGLRKRGVEARAYFAPLEDKVKKKVQEYWIKDQCQVIVATIAFGMGIDKPDVYFVIHHCVPKSLEGYYQESGRAGRDGQKAYCVLMFGLADYLRNVAMCSSNREVLISKPILSYCLNNERCRRALIAEHFEDTWRDTDCSRMCDNCKSPKQLCNYNITSAYRDILRLIELAVEKEVKLTLNKLINAWFQTGTKELRIAKLSPPKCNKTQAEHIVAYLIDKGYLSVDKGYTMYTTVPYIVRGSVTPKAVILMAYDSDLKYPSVGSNDQEGEKHSPAVKRMKIM